MTIDRMPQETAEIITVSPDLAANWLQSWTYKHQRPLRRDYIAFLATEMESGRFFTTVIRIAIVNGNKSIIDGQHRLHAVVQSGKSQVFTVITTVAESEDELGRMYSKIDTGRRRTSRDAYSAFNLAERFDLPATFIDKFGPGSLFIGIGCTGTSYRWSRWKRSSQDEAIRLMEIYASAARQFYSSTTGVNGMLRREVYRQYAVALGLLTFRFAGAYNENGRTVEKFWRGIVEDDGLSARDPRKLANLHFRETVMGNGGRGSIGKKPISAVYGIRYVAGCFNAYMQGETRQQIRVTDENAPLRAYGVPQDTRVWRV